MWIDDYKPTEYAQSFDCSDGDHSLQILKAEAKKSKQGNNMIEVSFKVDNIGATYIERYTSGEYFDSIMTRFFDAFKMDRGDFALTHWIGKTGFARFQHKEETFTDQNGQPQTRNKARIQYLIVPGSEETEQAADTSYTFTKEQAEEMKTMTTSAVFAADEVQEFRDELAAHKVTASDLLWKVRNQYTARLKNSTATKKPVQEDIW